MDTPRIDRESIAHTYELIRPFVRRTLTMAIEGADCNTRSCDVVLELEQLQHTGSFKARGAFASMLLRNVPCAGVAAASGGNHGVAVAYAARRLEKPARIFLPSVAAPAKIERIREYGAELVIAGDRYADAMAECEAWSAESGAAQHPLWDRLRIVTEPGDATAFAGLVSGRYTPAAGERVGVLLCGGNTTIDWPRR